MVLILPAGRSWNMGTCIGKGSARSSQQSTATQNYLMMQKQVVDGALVRARVWLSSTFFCITASIYTSHVRG